MNTTAAALGLVLGYGITVQAQVPDQRFEASPGQTLDVNLKTGGDVTIRGVAEGFVTVKTRLSGRDADHIKVSVERTKGGVSIVSRYDGAASSQSSSACFEVTVPVRFNSELKTMGGKIQLEGLEGSQEGSTMGGALTLSGLKGKVNLSTMGGNISLTASQVDGKVSTMGGNVKLKDVVGDVKGSTMGGNVDYDNVRSAGKERVEAKTMGGEIKVASAPAGAHLQTMGGAIRIASAKDFVEAKTMGGDIEIKELDGGAQASTMGGNITVTMVGDPAVGKRDVELVSKGGTIRLTLPAGLAMGIEVTLEHTKNSGRTCRIDSDFPLTVSETPEWKESAGGARKIMKGTGTFGGGKNKIVIRTVNGDVVIRKR